MEWITRNRTAWAVGFTVLCLIAALLLPAMPQPLAYHAFADRRTLFGIPNFLDVTSNLAFVVAGLAGIIVVFHPRTRWVSSAERWPYAFFFFGLLLTSAGSAYYHLAPGNERLFWDRLPMTVAFMSLVSAQISDRTSPRVGVALLAPMILVGAASVLYWRFTEDAGKGNVLPYGVLQGYAVVILALLAFAFPSRYTRGRALYGVFAAYVAAKVFETLDREILALGHVVSGHTLKHLAAGVAGLIICRMLWLRAPAEPAYGGAPGRS